MLHGVPLSSGGHRRAGLLVRNILHWGGTEKDTGVPPQDRANRVPYVLSDAPLRGRRSRRRMGASPERKRDTLNP